MSTSPVVRPTTASAFFPTQRGAASSMVIDGSPRTATSSAPWGGPAELVKDTFDTLAAATALLVLSPLLIALAVLVRLTSDGPALYSQDRVGRHGRIFRIWKFRTMVTDADAELQQLLQRHDRAGTPLFKVPNDPRVTRIGAVLRKYSLDELPQLFNVLIGDMSLIGPRPQRPDEVALYTAEHRTRLAVRPGLTGLWQVHGRSDLPWDEAVQHDLRYVNEWSLKLDVHILFKTPMIVLTGRGAV